MYWLWLDVPALIASAPRTYLFPMVDRDPVERWSFGRATLLGDAAHPMYPIGSNGASQAILDARTLAGCLVSYADDVEHEIEDEFGGIHEQAAAPVLGTERKAPFGDVEPWLKSPHLEASEAVPPFAR